MSKGIANSIIRNTSIMLAQQIVTWTSGIVLVMFLARYLGPVEYGRLFLANSVVAIFRIFVEYGGNYLIAKKVSRDPSLAGQIVVDEAGYRILFGILAYAGALVVAYSTGYPKEVQVLISIIGLALVWKGIMTVLVASYQGLETMQFTSLGSITEALFGSVVCVTALLLGANVITIAIITTTAGLLNCCMLLVFSRKIAAVFPRINWKATSGQIKEGVPYFLLAIFGTIYYRIDTLMLGKMAPEQVVGWYGAAYRLFDVLNFFPYIFTTAIFPVLSRLWNKEEQKHTQITQRSVEFMVIIGIPVTVGAIAIAPYVVQFLYGLPAYEGTIALFRILSLGIVFLFADMVIGTTLLTSNRQSQQSMLALGAIVVNVGLNYFLITYFQLHAGNGGIGCGIATVLTEFFIMVTGIAILPKGILAGFRFPVVFKSAVAGLVMGLFLWLLLPTRIPWFVLALLSPFVYGPMLFLMRTFDEGEQALFVSMFTVSNLKSLVTGKRKP